MRTILGLDVTDADLDRDDTKAKILAGEKFNIVKGIVSDHIVSGMVDAVGSKDFLRIPCQTVIVETQSASYRTLVWTQGDSAPEREGVAKLCGMLTKLNMRHEYDEKLKGLKERNVTNRLMPVRYSESESDFFTRGGEWLDERAILAEPERLFNGMDVPMTDRLRSCVNREPTAFKVGEGACDRKETERLFYEYMKPNLASKDLKLFVQSRIYKNQIAAYTKSLWDLDTVVMVGGRIFVIEEKVKFPIIHSGGLAEGFGINQGELDLFGDLVGQTGLSVGHVVIVQPRWRSLSVTDWINEEEDRSHTILAMCSFDSETVRRIQLNGPCHDPREGSNANGIGKMKFYPLKPELFVELGVLSDGFGVLGARLRDAMTGVGLPRLSAKRLHEMRLH